MTVRTAEESAVVRPRPWTRGDTVRTARLFAVIALLHAVGWGVLLFVVMPAHLTVGSAAFGLGLGVTAYTLGARHAFDADHLALIDNTTRKLMADGQRPVSVGFWFALGHSTLVVGLALLIAAGTRAASTLLDRGSGAHQVLSVAGVSASALFLYLVGLLNLVALLALLRARRRLRAGRLDDASLRAVLDNRGLLARVLRRATRSITTPRQAYPVGVLMGLGFDTATEVSLLVLASSGAASGLPWYAVLVLPLLFAAGMSLFDTLDGAFMSVAYAWANSSVARTLSYNLVVTAISVAVALGVGTVELVGVLHDEAGLTDPVTSRIAGLSLGSVGYLVVGLFALVWGGAVLRSRLVARRA